MCLPQTGQTHLRRYCKGREIMKRQFTAKERSQCLRWHVTHGEDVTATCARFGISRATLYRWLAQNLADPQKSLGAQPGRSKHTQPPPWTLGDLCLLSDLAMDHPQATHRQFYRMLTVQTGVQFSEATVG